MDIGNKNYGSTNFWMYNRKITSLLSYKLDKLNDILNEHKPNSMTTRHTVLINVNFLLDYLTQQRNYDRVKVFLNPQLVLTQTLQIQSLWGLNQPTTGSCVGIW